MISVFNEYIRKSKKDNLQSQTTCEIYHSVPIDELLPSVQASLHRYLHHGSSFTGNNLKLHLKNLVGSIRYYTTYYKYKLIDCNKCDVIFQFINANANYLGIQKLIAENYQRRGFKTGIIYPNFLLENSEFTDIFLIPQNILISSKIRKLISDQCRLLYSYFQEIELPDLDFSVYKYLVDIANLVEQRAFFLQQLLEAKQPKVVILLNSKSLEDTAMQIACSRIGISSILFLHGFPQQSQYPLSAKFVTSICPHHNDYLKKLSLPNAQIIQLGWLEPHAILNSSIRDKFPNTNAAKKYHVLFLSQIFGWQLHRCQSLVQRLPNILKSLDKISEVETITIRLRPNEVNDVVIRTLIAECGCTKLKISTNCSLANDLSLCNMIVSFSSTGLLYGPYLNKRAIEIRDDSINSVWGGNILPSEQVYHIGQEFNSIEFREFVMQSQVIEGQDVFYNWGSELDALSNFL